MATSLNQPLKNGLMIVQYMNPAEQQLTLRDGTTISTIDGVDNEQVQNTCPGLVESEFAGAPSTGARCQNICRQYFNQ